MTPKQRVIAKWPDAFCVIYSFSCVIFRRKRLGLTQIGTGPTPRAAWADATKGVK
jgi:hypothetical protein